MVDCTSLEVVVKDYEYRYPYIACMEYYLGTLTARNRYCILAIIMACILIHIYYDNNFTVHTTQQYMYNREHLICNKADYIFMYNKTKHNTTHS